MGRLWTPSGHALEYLLPAETIPHGAAGQATLLEFNTGDARLKVDREEAEVPGKIDWHAFPRTLASLSRAAFVGNR